MTNTIQRKNVRVLEIFHVLSVANGSTLGTWKIPSVKARMIRQARGVGEACERLLFRQTFWFEQVHVCRQISRDSRSQGKKECSSSQSLSFSFSHIRWK